MKQVKSILTRNRFFETIFEFWKLDEFELMFGFEHFGEHVANFAYLRI